MFSKTYLFFFFLELAVSFQTNESFHNNATKIQFKMISAFFRKEEEEQHVIFYWNVTLLPVFGTMLQKQWSFSPTGRKSHWSGFPPQRCCSNTTHPWLGIQLLLIWVGMRYLFTSRELSQFKFHFYLPSSFTCLPAFCQPPRQSVQCLYLQGFFLKAPLHKASPFSPVSALPCYL